VMRKVVVDLQQQVKKSFGHPRFSTLAQ
jgi:hypothetical protein